LKTLPDYLGPGLALVSIGLNPSLASARAGFYFANPRNRFWRALAGSGLAPAGLEPGPAAQERLFRVHRIGFTDLVKRPTAGGAALRARDYREGAARLSRRLLEHAPLIAWFHGKQAYRAFLRYTDGSPGALAWGEQPRRAGASVVFVTPNPSPANAAYSLATLIEWYRALGALRARLET